MKKTAFLFLIVAFVLLFRLVAFDLPYTALAESDIQSELNDEVNSGINELIDDGVEDFYADIKSDGYSVFGDSIKQIATQILNGEGIDMGRVFELLWQAVKDSFTGLISGFISIIGLSILYGISKNINGGFMKESTSKIVYFSVYGAIICNYTAMLAGIIYSANITIDRIKALVDISFPILITLLTAIGGVSGVSVFQQAILVFGNVVINIIKVAILPMFYACVVFSVIGNLTENIKLDKLTKAVSSIAKWALGIIFGLFTTIVTSAGLVGNGVDNVNIKSAKFALSGYVPILGGYLSDGFDIVMAGAVLIKNSFGLCVLIMLLTAIILPTTKIIIFIISTKFTAGIVEPVSGPKISGMLYSVSKSLSIVISIILGLSFIVFVMITLVISSCNSGVV